MSPDQLNALIEKVMEQLGPGGGGNKDSPKTNKNLVLTPTHILVIAAILGGVLKVHSILLDDTQSVQILLTGSLKRKTALDKMLDQIGPMSFDQVARALLDHYGV
ncbi:MAG: hypothetical protein AB1500_09020 [Bacillota bacterium]